MKMIDMILCRINFYQSGSQTNSALYDYRKSLNKEPERSAGRAAKFVGAKWRLSSDVKHGASI